MEPTFIISFDCEGKWGMADCLNPAFESRLRTQQLLSVYDRIVETLDRHEIKATFAFVGLFTIDPDDWHEIRPWAEEAILDRAYLKSFFENDAAGQHEGWFGCSAAAEKIAKHSDHEFGSHSFSHCMIDETTMTEADFARDLDALRKLPLFADLDDLTFIYPRNQIGYPKVLESSGYIGFREALPQPAGRLGRVQNLIKEFGAKIQPQPHPKPAKLVQIPSGYFLNWRSGLRAKVPLQRTINRWRNLLSQTAKEGGVAHLWSHPHNFIEYPGMFEQFDAILAHAAELIRSGELQSQTMKEYARSLQS
ncbi:MAG: peptidoglycan/xylan/chitin deacetylase (PgdA/CDA1 family) [Verrucomicrobiales bacterium]|jgi:peptidoglycan/xylan/chitin deacetylase (PgdA/CDA1 family)